MVLRLHLSGSIGAVFITQMMVMTLNTIWRVSAFERCRTLRKRSCALRLELYEDALRILNTVVYCRGNELKLSLKGKLG